MKVFVGYDTREDIAYQVCKHSILNKQPDADVRPLKQQELREAGWYTRAIDKLASTEFTFTRFLIPELTNFKGWALFMDCDMIMEADIETLIEKDVWTIIMNYPDQALIKSIIASNRGKISLERYTDEVYLEVLIDPAMRNMFQRTCADRTAGRVDPCFVTTQWIVESE